MSTEIPTGDMHDFNFLIGHWNVVSRRLQHRWASSDDWDVFSGTCRCVAYLGGLANVDEFVFPTKGFAGMTVRLFDRARRCWSIYWSNSDGAVLFPPVLGGFSGERGEFFGDDRDDGQPIKVRCLWTRQDADHARWQQAFSRDGVSWEWNWTMDLSRIAP
jgi:hypothetical protein